MPMIKNLALDKLVGTTLGTYYLERFVGYGKIGPTFLAHSDATNATAIYLLQFLEGPLYASPKDHEVHLEHFQYQAGQIATLKHPYILPLSDFGVFRGLPYLVSPHIPLRSLRTRIDKNGALNTFTVGRYLDQIATALEYAHEHAVLHGSLSVDTIFIRLDGQLVVTNVGVRNLLEAGTQDMTRNQPLTWSDGYAPEQLLGKPASPATDIYALGMVAYHLLTGSSVFEGNTPDDIAQKHLYASIPPLNQRRSDLPVGLYTILARALAKDPAQRFQQPGAFANAYHTIVIPTNRTRMPFVVSEAPAMKANQPYVTTGIQMAERQFTERTWNTDRPATNEHTSGLQRTTKQSSMPHSLHGFTEEKPLSLSDSLQDNPRPGLMRRFQSKQRQRTMLIASLILVLVIATSVAGITLLAQKSSGVARAGGQVMFFANQDGSGEQTNSLHINVQNLATPPAGYDYEAWLINDQTEEVTDLGKLVQKNQNWFLAYSGASSNLLNAGDKLEITQEQGAANAPAGKVMLTGTFPVKSFQHVQHLLVSFPPTPGKVGLLIGVLQQTHLLNNQAEVLQNVTTSQNTAAIECVTQSMFDIIEGTHGLHYLPLPGTCAQQNVSITGDGFGLLGKGYLASAEKHASLALSQPDATSVMHQHAALMDTALANITGWVTTIEQDALHLHTHPTDLTSIQEITTLADDTYHGVDVNGDGQIDPVVGEAGAISAFQQGQLMATLSLAPSI